MWAQQAGLISGFPDFVDGERDGEKTIGIVGLLPGKATLIRARKSLPDPVPEFDGYPPIRGVEAIPYETLLKLLDK